MDPLLCYPSAYVEWRTWRIHDNYDPNWTRADRYPNFIEAAWKRYVYDGTHNHSKVVQENSDTHAHLTLCWQTDNSSGTKVPVWRTRSLGVLTVQRVVVFPFTTKKRKISIETFNVCQVILADASLLWKPFLRENSFYYVTPVWPGKTLPKQVSATVNCEDEPALVVVD